jgi:hypothetical protein
MGKWATYRKRGRGADAPIPAPTPVLAFDVLLQLNWHVDDVSPSSANIFVDSGSGLAVVDNVDWTGGQPYDATAFEGDRMAVQGLDSDGNPVTELSNVITIP